MSVKRFVAMGDFHSGHIAGLTPPMWQIGKDRSPQWHAVEVEMWEWYKSTLSKLQPIEWCLLNGDLLEGNGYRNSGVELWSTDRIQQCDAAITAAKQVRPKSGFVVNYGTASHCGTSEDFEDYIASHLGCEAHSAPILDVGGVLFDTRHHIGTSTVPWSRHTAVAKERALAVLTAAMTDDVIADVYLRSHCHYHQFCGGPSWLAMTLPALQAAGSKYGKRRCLKGEYHVGLVHFDIDTNKRSIVGWKAHILKAKTAASKVVKL